MLVLELKESIHTALDSRVQTELISMRASGQIAIYHNLIGIVVKAQLIEIPEVIVSLITEVEAVKTTHPPHLHFNVKGRTVDSGMDAGVVPHIIDTYHIAVGHYIPIGEVTVDTWYLCTRELKHLEARLRHLYLRLSDGCHSRKYRKE
jgi:hypothetical protein